MRRLILFRHGKAEPDAASGDDFDRGLTDSGRAAAAAMGRLLAVSGSSPDLALVSSAVRTVQTFEAARPAFPRAGETLTRALYLASAEDIRSAIKAAADTAEVLMVVGHNPGLHDLALRLSQEDGSLDLALRKLQDFPPGAAAVFDFDAEGLPTLMAVNLPR